MPHPIAEPLNFVHSLLTCLPNELSVFDPSASIEDMLERTILHHRILFSHIPPDHTRRLSALQAISHCLVQNFKHQGQTEGFNDAIEYRPHAFTCRTSSTGDLIEGGTKPNHLTALLLGSLGNTLMLRFQVETLPRLDDLDKAAESYAVALDLYKDDDDIRVSLIKALVRCCIFRFEKRESMKDIDRAIELLLMLQPAQKQNDAPNSTALSQCMLGMAFMIRYQSSADLVDVGKAIENFTTALVVFPNDSPKRLQLLDQLVFSSMERYNKTGRLEDLDEATAHKHEADTLRSVQGSGHSYKHANASSTRTPVDTSVIQFEAAARAEELDEETEIRIQAPNPCIVDPGPSVSQRGGQAFVSNVLRVFVYQG